MENGEKSRCLGTRHSKDIFMPAQQPIRCHERVAYRLC